MNCKSMCYVLTSMLFAFAVALPSMGQGTKGAAAADHGTGVAEVKGPGRFASSMKTIRIFERMLSDHEFVKKLGLSEEAVKNLSKGFEGMGEKEKDLQGKKNEMQRQQMERLAAVLASCSDPSAGAAGRQETYGKLREELETAFLRTEAIQHERNLLTVQRIMLIRENLTDEQLAKAVELARGRMEKTKRHPKDTRVRPAGKDKDGGDREKMKTAKRRREKVKNPPEGD